MKSTKSVNDLTSECESTMRWGGGEEVICRLDWDRNYFYLWIEPTWGFEDFCEAEGLSNLLEELNAELEKIGVQQFCSIDEVNSYLEDLCGDDDPAYFYEDELFGDLCLVGR